MDYHRIIADITGITDIDVNMDSDYIAEIILTRLSEKHGIPRISLSDSGIVCAIWGHADLYIMFDSKETYIVSLNPSLRFSVYNKYINRIYEIAHNLLSNSMQDN